MAFYNAVVIQVPGLDMQRHNRLLAGASWMAEYGNTDKPKSGATSRNMEIPFYYFENTEGRHGNGVTNEQRVKTLALTYSYLWMQLGGRVTP